MTKAACCALFLACAGLAACGTEDPAAGDRPDASGMGGSSSGGGGGSGGSASGGSGGTGAGGAAGSGGNGATGAGGASGAGGATSDAGADAGRDGGATTTDAGRDAGRDAGAGGTAGRDGGAGGATGAGGTAGTGGALPALRIWIAGDSTVATGSAPCPIGWGGQFLPHFTDRVTITNSAVAGRSVRTWLYNVLTTMDNATGECNLTRDAAGNPTVQARWQAMLNATTGMKAGDYLFIQFGINDTSATCDRHVGLEAFKTSYGVMAQAAKDRGAHPIFVTPVSSISCSGTTARGSRGAYVTATQQAGTQYGVPVIDLHALSVALYNARAFCPVPGGDVSASTTGPVGDFFCDDHTHFSRTGAVDIANLMAQALRDQAIPLAAYLR